MEPDMWATLPCDLLIEIFRRLGSTAVIRSAGVCRPWRRAIINSAASCLRPRPDRFLPGLLVSLWDAKWHRRRRHGRLEYVSGGGGPSETVVTMDDDSGIDDHTLRLLASSRGGFLLFRAAGSAANTNNSDLWMFNLDAGSCRLLPAAAAALGAASSEHRREHCRYLFATSSYKDGNGGGGSALRILAVPLYENVKDGVTYQVFSSTSGDDWGPLKRSAKINEDDNVSRVIMSYRPKHVMVNEIGSVVYWLAIKKIRGRGPRKCLIAIDLFTDQTWTTDLPEECEWICGFSSELILATSEDSQRLSLIMLQGSRQSIEVWVLADDDDSRLWTLQGTIDLQSIFPNCASLKFISFGGFCPRSGCLFGFGTDRVHHPYFFVVAIDGSSPQLRETVDIQHCYDKIPYEMSWSTYISKMKYF